MNEIQLLEHIINSSPSLKNAPRQKFKPRKTIYFAIDANHEIPGVLFAASNETKLNKLAIQLMEEEPSLSFEIEQITLDELDI